MKIQRLIQLICLSVLLVACSNDDLVSVDSIVSIPQSGFSTQTALLDESTYSLRIYKSSIGDGDIDANVKVAIDEAAWNTFQQENPAYANYTLLPEMYYSILNENVSIAKGSNEGYLKIKLKNIDVNFSNTKYVLPISIQEVSGKAKVNEVKSVAFLNFNQYRNAYAGLHKAYGESIGGDGFIDKIDQNKTLVSAGLNSVSTNLSNSTTIKMTLTIKDNGEVTVGSAPGFESYNIRNNDAEESTYTGKFDDEYQRNKGVYKLSYKYDVSINVGGTLFTTTYTVKEEIKFWL